LQQQLQPKKQTGGFAMTKSKSLDPDIMSQFTGSEHWYRHALED
jgi:hypothetical protein